LDRETGLYYAGARYYDPRVSIWLSVDPLVEQTLDAYGYCFQNPVNLIDPDGEYPIPISPYGLYAVHSAKVNQEYLYLRATTDKSKTSAYINAQYNVSRNSCHFLLDIAGFVPVFGEVFDGINAAWYALEGEYKEACLSLASMIPLADFGTKGVKWLSITFKISENTSSLIKSIGKTSENGKEILMKTFSNTFNDAKKIAQDITKVGDEAVDYVSTVKGSPFHGKVLGKTDGKNYWRIDVDKTTGEAHINWQVGNKKGRIDFGGGERNVKSIIDNVLNK